MDSMASNVWMPSWVLDSIYNTKMKNKTMTMAAMAAWVTTKITTLEIWGF
jgi:hypothetical protein